jgi:hypothetical protein
MGSHVSYFEIRASLAHQRRMPLIFHTKTEGHQDMLSVKIESS